MRRLDVRQLASQEADLQQRFMRDMRRIEQLQGLSDQGWTSLERGAVRKHVEARASVLYRGQPVSGAYIVLAGRLRVFTITPNGLEATLYFMDPGDTCVLALNCLFSDLLYPSWVQAEEATTILFVPGVLYRQLFGSEPSIQRMTVNALSSLVFRLMAELDSVHSGTHRQRLAQFVLMHAASDGRLKMTQQQIARHLGTTREVIARLMQDFIARGVLGTGRGLVVIKDLFALRRVVAPDPPVKNARVGG